MSSLKSETYIGKNGKLNKRRKCSIRGCECIRDLSRYKMANGSYRYYEDKVCGMHRVDGSKRRNTAYKGMTPVIKERGWKQKGIAMTVKEYNKLFRKQKGCCAICGKHVTEFKRALAVDHNHVTGRIRGLLCARCNVFVAHLDDFPGISEKALEYLENS